MEKPRYKSVLNLPLEGAKNETAKEAETLMRKTRMQ